MYRNVQSKLLSQHGRILLRSTYVLNNEVNGQKRRKENNRNGGPCTDSFEPSERFTPTQGILNQVETTNDSKRQER